MIKAFIGRAVLTGFILLGIVMALAPRIGVPWRRSFWRMLGVKFIPDHYRKLPEHTLLNGVFSFYQNLDSSQQRKFLWRVINFREFRKWRFAYIPEEPKWVCETLISATAVQLTFGLGDYLLIKYQYVNIYEEQINYRRRMVIQGGVTLHNNVYLCWKPFVEGFANDRNGWNLGLHEWAHALKLSSQHISSDNHDFMDYFPLWTKTATTVFEKTLNEPTGFRDFPTKEMSEFFPVCVERFFECPEEFKEEFPELYECTRILLKIDPLKFPRRVFGERPELSAFSKIGPAQHSDI